MPPRKSKIDPSAPPKAPRKRKAKPTALECDTSKVSDPTVVTGQGLPLLGSGGGADGQKSTARRPRKKPPTTPSVKVKVPAKRRPRAAPANGPKKTGGPKTKFKNTGASPGDPHEGSGPDQPPPVRRGRGRPRGSKNSTYTRREPRTKKAEVERPSGVILDAAGEIDLEATVRLHGNKKTGVRGRPVGKGRGRGRGRGRASYCSDQRSATVRAMLAKDLRLYEEERKSEEEPDQDGFDFDNELMEALLRGGYDERGEQMDLPTRCPLPPPISHSVSVELGRRGRKRRLAVERKNEAPVHDLFKKVTRMSEGMESKDYGRQLCLRTLEAAVSHRKEVVAFTVSLRALAPPQPYARNELTWDYQAHLINTVTDGFRHKLWNLLFQSPEEPRMLEVSVGLGTLMPYYRTNTKIGDCFTEFYRKQYRSLCVLFPNTFQRVREVIRIGLETASHICDDLDSMGQECSSVHVVLSDWEAQIDRLEWRKDKYVDVLEAYNKSPVFRKLTHLDESCIWGLKPVRIAFASPYFKTADAMRAAPSIFEWTPAFDKEKMYPVGRHKWTTRDMAHIRLSIREVLIEHKIEKIEAKYTDCIRECNDQRDRMLDFKRLEGIRLGHDTERYFERPKKRGRPKKDPVYAQITRHLLTLSYDPSEQRPKLVVSQNLNNVHIQNWRREKLDQVQKLKYEDMMKDPANFQLIDWEAVANKLSIGTKKPRYPEDCRLISLHSPYPAFKRRWSAPESTKLTELVNDPRQFAWKEIAECFGGERTEFSCFFKYRNVKGATRKISWDDGLDEQLLTLAIELEGDWTKVGAHMDEELADKNSVVERYKKKVNPILRNGAFSNVEDTLLLLAIEKLKAHMNREGHFGELTAYLPWRYESTWRDRAGNVFADWIVPWTLEEDKKLLEFAVTFKRSWKHIAGMFKSFKNRKGCLTRHKILEKGLQKYGCLEHYHETYAMTRYNTFQCEHLDRVLELLKGVLKQPLIPFHGLDPLRPPTEDELQLLLLAYNKLVVSSAIRSVEEYLAGRNKQWIEWIENHGKKQKTFDRRTFHPENPKSVASALHIRGVLLVPKEEVGALTTFQTEIYTHYARFTRTKALKKDALRPYLPSGSDLLRMEEIKDILLGFAADRCPTPPVGDQERGRGRWKRKLDAGSGPKAKKSAGKQKRMARKAPPPRRGPKSRKNEYSESDSDSVANEYLESSTEPESSDFD